MSQVSGLLLFIIFSDPGTYQRIWFYLSWLATLWWLPIFFWIKSKCLNMAYKILWDPGIGPLWPHQAGEERKKGDRIWRKWHWSWNLTDLWERTRWWWWRAFSGRRNSMGKVPETGRNNVPGSTWKTHEEESGRGVCRGRILPVVMETSGALRSQRCAYGEPCRGSSGQMTSSQLLK